MASAARPSGATPPFASTSRSTAAFGTTSAPSVRRPSSRSPSSLHTCGCTQVMMYPFIYCSYVGYLLFLCICNDVIIVLNRGKAVRVFLLFAMLRPAVSANLPPAHAHGREALPLQDLRRSLHNLFGAQQPHGHAHRHQEVSNACICTSSWLPNNLGARSSCTQFSLISVFPPQSNLFMTTFFPSSFFRLRLFAYLSIPRPFFY